MKLHSRIKNAWYDRYPSSQGVELTLNITKDVFNKDLLELRFSVKQLIEGSKLPIPTHEDLIVKGHDIINVLTTFEKLDESTFEYDLSDIVELSNDELNLTNDESGRNSKLD